MVKFIRQLLVLAIIFLMTGCHRSQQSTQVDQPYVFLNHSTSAVPKLLPVPPKFVPFISIAAVGDIMLGNYSTYYIQKYGVDYPFDSTRQILTAAHLTFGNLEAPFTRTGAPFDKKFTFKVPPEYAIGLIQAGFDVVTLANNHILDYGIEGLKNTISTLDSIGLAYCGAGLTRDQARKPAIIERNGYRVGLLGYSMTFPEEFWATHSSGGTNFPDEEDMRIHLEGLDTLVDFSIVTFHWGAELSNYPKDYQKYFAHRSIDFGADLVIGHHPHVLQGIEIYKNRLIAYSLGNFTFSSYSRKAAESIILRVYLSKSGLVFARVIPVIVNNYQINFQPRVLSGTFADTVITHLKKFSEPLNSNAIIDDCGYLRGEKYTR